jgi:hypothetical protein
VGRQPTGHVVLVAAHRDSPPPNSLGAADGGAGLAAILWRSRARTRSREIGPSLEEETHLSVEARYFVAGYVLFKRSAEEGAEI